MPFDRKLLNPGEEIKLDLHPHWWFFAGPAATLAGVIVLAIVVRFWLLDEPGTPTTIASWFFVVALLVAAGWLGIRYLTWSTTNFVITTDRLIFRRGIFAKAGIEIPLDRVNNVNFNQSFWERIVGAGDLLIESGGEDGQQRFSDIRKPSVVQNIIHRTRIEHGGLGRAPLGQRPGSSPLPPPPPGGAPPATDDDPLRQIEKLDELRARGIITQAEFEAKKIELLGKL